MNKVMKKPVVSNFQRIPIRLRFAHISWACEASSPEGALATSVMKAINYRTNAASLPGENT